MNSNKKYLEVGKIISVTTWKKECKYFHYGTPFDKKTRFTPYILDENKQYQKLSLQWVVYQHPEYKAKADDSISEQELMWLNKKAIYREVSLDEVNKMQIQGEYWYADVINCDVFLGEAYLGKVVSVENFGAQDVLMIDTTKSSQDEKGMPLLSVKALERTDKNKEQADTGSKDSFYVYLPVVESKIETWNLEEKYIRYQEDDEIL